MKICFFFIICLFLEIRATVQNVKIDEFLQTQSRLVKEKITNKIRSIRAADLNNLEEKILGTFEHECKAKPMNVNIFTLFNSTFIKIDEEVFKFVFNKSFSLEFYAELPETSTDDIVLLRALEHNEFGVMILGFRSGDTIVYKVSKDENKFEKIQSIATENAVDAKMFINNGQMYFILVKKDGSSLYKWMGSYFDDTETAIFTYNATKVTSFAYKTSEIIVILQGISGRKSYSYVYEFRNDKLKKNQLLETDLPYHVDTFTKNNRRYMIIYENSKRNVLYVWQGLNLREISTFRWDQNIAKSTNIVYSNSTPLIVKPELGKVEVYGLHGKTIELEYTKNHLTNYSVILDVNKGRNENGNISFIAGLSEDNIININATSFRALHPEMEREEDGTLRKCFINLEEKIYEERKRLNQTEMPILPISNSFQEDPIRHEQKRNADFIVFPTDETTIESQLVTMQNRLDKVKDTIINRADSRNDLVFNKTVTLNFPIFAKNVKAKQMTVEKINDINWTPENWLSYTEPQTVTGSVKIPTVKANTLVIHHENGTFFEHLVRNKGNVTLSGKIFVKNLTANRTTVEKINDILFQNIALKSHPITGKKIFSNVRANIATVKIINGKNSDQVIDSFNNTPYQILKFESNVTIKDLWVENIDGVNWEEFKNSVFQIAENNNTIKGNLVLRAIKAGKIEARFVNGLRPGDLLTKTTNQTIKSNIEFNNIKALKIRANFINDIDVENIAVSGQNFTIESPVLFNDIFVSNDLELMGDVDESFFYHEGDRLIGTNESDLKQIYIGKIVIQGDVYVNNLNVDPNAKFIVNGTNISANFFESFWSKTKNQIIHVHFEATEGISVPHLETTRVNNIKINNFALNNAKTVLEGPLYFDSIIVNGDVVLNKSENNFPDLKALEKRGVKKNGTFIIRGKKTFKNSLKVKNLATNQLNYISVYDALTTECSASFETLMIKGNLTSNIATNVINGINIEELLENAIYINKPQNLSKLDFKNLTVENLYVENINGYKVDVFIKNLEDILLNKKITSLIINGDTTINNIRNVSTINNVDTNAILRKASKIEPDFIGDIKFLKKVRVNNLVAPLINKINFPELNQRLLYRMSNQTVTAQYTFENLKTANLYTSEINSKSVENLIDITSDFAYEIFVPKGIIFKNTTMKSLRGMNFPCDIHKAVTEFKYPKNQKWNTIEILGNVTILDEKCDLYKMLHKTVRSDKVNIITAPVGIKGNLTAERIQIFNNCINDIDVEEILNDSLLSFSEEGQIVTGHKSFSTIYASHVLIMGNGDIPLIVTEETDIVVPDFYKMIISKNEVQNISITGKKTFLGGLQADKFWVEKIMGIIPENIVTLANLSQIPNAVFDSVEVRKNLNIKFVNDKNLNHIFENRLLLNSSEPQIINSVCFFEDLEVEDITTSSINDVMMDDVVFDIGTQTIIAPKTFIKDLRIIGNVSVEYINNVNVTEAFESAILVDQKNIVNGSMVVQKPSRIFGNVTAHEINGFSIEKINEILGKITNTDDEKYIYEIQKQVKGIVRKYLPESYYLPNEFMYMEKSSDIQITVNNAKDARITKTKDYVLIHIASEESPEKCNLPEGCKCPVQQTVEITPEKSVSYFLNKAQQRIYSYDDDTMSIHFITNSVSSSTECRTNQSKFINEISTLTWSTTPSTTQNGLFNYYPPTFTGYITGAEFFTISGKTYGVIANYYDSVLDTFNLDCTVIKFSDDKKSLNEIQKIPTQGVQTINILHTAQGVLLIIGNTKGDAFTEIYRFSEEHDKFLLLRTVAYGCTKSVGVVLGADSLVILANENQNSPLQVLKYNPSYDNYYYYQMFTLEETVIGLSVFYVGGFGISDAFLCVVTEEYFRIYSFQYIDGWKLESQGSIKGLRNLVPFEMGKQLFLFAPSSEESMLLTVVKHGTKN